MQGLPGGELIDNGLADLARSEETVESLLVSIGSPKLRALGVGLGPAFENPEHRLYALLGRKHGDNAHGQYNALVRLLVSYEKSPGRACARRPDRSPTRLEVMSASWRHHPRPGPCPPERPR